jgi:hypothetical protein
VVVYVPTIKSVQETLAYVAIGMSFAVGRTFHHFLAGCVFVFFDHAYDIGDRVDIFNMSSTSATPVVVKRISLLYTVFRRLDNGTDLQISNERLQMQRIENVTRSGLNRQGLSLFVDFQTSFKDIMRLREELEKFLSENKRDYVHNTLVLSIISLHELNKMELRISFNHKSNWSDERLRGARSNRFYCALVAACRRIPLYKPDGATPTLGEDGKPMYTVMINDDKAKQKVSAELARRDELRWDHEKAEGESLYAAPEMTADMSEEQYIRKKAVSEGEAAKEAAEAAKLAVAREVEEAAFTSLSVLPNSTVTTTEAVSTGVELQDSVRGMTGLRMKSNTGADVMQYR